jgi:hypothetical protein
VGSLLQPVSINQWMLTCGRHVKKGRAHNAREHSTVTRVEYVRFEVFTAANMKNAAFWDIKTQFMPHRKHIMSSL